MANRSNVVYLSNGVPMPLLGLGTSHGGGYNQNAVVYAIRDCGYRHVDTAKRYGCEQYIRDAIEQSGVPREEMFLASKMWPRDYGFLSGKSALSKSLDNLGTDYLDLYMMHWPLCLSGCANSKETLLETWRALEVSLDEGRCKAIGVSNFYISDLENILEDCSVVPHVDQCEFHPYQNPKELRRFCQGNRIQFEGYCPLAKGAILNEKPVMDISRMTGRTPAQVLIRWAVQNQVVTIPKSTKENRVWENCQVFDFELSSEQMAVLDNLHSNLRAVNPDEVQSKIDDNKPDGYKLFLTNPRASLPRETEQA